MGGIIHKLQTQETAARKFDELCAITGAYESEDTVQEMCQNDHCSKARFLGRVEDEKG